MRAIFVFALVAMLVVVSVDAGKNKNKKNKHKSTPAPAGTPPPSSNGGDRAGAERTSGGNPRFRAPQAHQVPRTLDELAVRARENSARR